MSIQKDLDALSEQCFAMETKLPLWGREDITDSDRAVLRQKLYQLRIAINGVKRYAKTNEIEDYNG